MADIQLPRYELPNPALPLGQQAVSPVAQTNPLQSLAGGVNSGVSLGLQARQVKALEQERQVQMIAAQVQQQKNEEELLTNAWQKIADLKNMPSYQSHLISAIDPLMKKVLSRHGIQIDMNHPDLVENDPAHKEVQAVMASDLPWDQKATALQAVHLKYPSQTDLGSTIDAMSQQLMARKKGQDELIQQEKQRQESLRGDQLLQQTELKRSAAGSLYNQLRLSQKENGEYDITVPQMVEMYGNLYRSQNGTGLTGEALPLMDQKTAEGNYSKLAAYFGLAKNALPKELGDRLLHMSEQLGDFNEAQHQKMMLGRDKRTPGIDETYAGPLSSDSRGLNFPEMKANADKASKYQTKTPSFKSAAEAEKADIPKGSIVLINGKRFRKD